MSFLLAFFGLAWRQWRTKCCKKVGVQQKKGRNFEAGMTETHDTVSYAFSMLQFICWDHQRISKHTMQNHKHSNTNHAQHKMKRKKKKKKGRSFEIGFVKGPLAYASQCWRSLLKSPKIFCNENDDTLLQYWSQNIQKRSSSSLETGVMKKERISFATCFYNFKDCGRKNNPRILLQWKLTNVVAVMNP